MAFQSKALPNYNENSFWQLQIGLRLVPLLKSSLSSLNLPSLSQVNIADYGSSEGLNSMLILSKAIEEFRSTSSIPIKIYHNDLPENNWSALSLTISNHPDSYKRIPEVYYSLIGRSFYEQVLPSNSVQIGFSILAFHFLSKPPARSGDLQVCYPEAEAQAIEDLTLNLTHRIKELDVGGYFVFTSPGKLEGHNGNNMEPYIIDCIKRIFGKGIITEEEYNDYIWQTYPMDLGQIRQILAGFRGIEIKLLEIEKVECPFYIEYKNGGSLEEYKRKFSNFPAALIKVALLRCLKTRTEQEKDIIYHAAMDEVRDMINGEETYILMYNVIIQKLSQ